MASGLVEPAGQRGPSLQPRGMLGQSQKYALSDFFGQGRFPQYPQCGRVDDIDVTTDKLRERLLTPAADVCPNEHLVSVIYHSRIIHRWSRKSDSHLLGPTGRLWLRRLPAGGSIKPSLLSPARSFTGPSI